MGFYNSRLTVPNDPIAILHLNFVNANVLCPFDPLFYLRLCDLENIFNITSEKTHSIFIVFF